MMTRIDKVVESLTPLERVRRTSKTGRPTRKPNIRPLEAVSDAQRFMAAVKVRMLEAGFDNPRIESALVVGTKTFPVSMDDAQCAATIAAILREFDTEPKILGVIFAITDGHAVEFWHRSFVAGREAQKTLDLAVADQARRLKAAIEGAQ
jgi:hypothetical protein